MWQRRSFHECADELLQISEAFRAEWKSHYRYDTSLAQRNPILRDASTRGVEVLRILALAVRADQDFGLIPQVSARVGAINEDATYKDASRVIASYSPPYSSLSGFGVLGLRQALNKIAHANPGRAGFFANAQHHDLILSGKNGAKEWVAVLSIIDLCKAIKSLPDHQIHS